MHVCMSPLSPERTSCPGIDFSVHALFGMDFKFRAGLHSKRGLKNKCVWGEDEKEENQAKNKGETRKLEVNRPSFSREHQPIFMCGGSAYSQSQFSSGSVRAVQSSTGDTTTSTFLLVRDKKQGKSQEESVLYCAGLQNCIEGDRSLLL